MDEIFGCLTPTPSAWARTLMAKRLNISLLAVRGIYATAAFGGDLVFVLLHRANFDRTTCLIVAAGVILALRLAGLRWKLALPVFRTRSQDQGPTD